MNFDKREINREYFYTYEWKNIKYKGVPLYKYPSDLVTYQEIIFDTKPNVIIETGTCMGSSATFFLDTMIACKIENPKVISIERLPYIREAPDTLGITFLVGSSLEPNIFNTVQSLINKTDKIMVSLDSDHIEDHVLKELNLYSNLVSEGCYLVVEDTFLGEYGVFTTDDESRFRPDTGKTPKDAVDRFLFTNKNFVIDTNRNKLISMNPNGYLLKC